MFIIVVLAAALGLWADGRKKKGSSCVQSIDVDSEGVETGSMYHFKINLLNGSQCSVGKKNWFGRILECDGTHAIGRFTFSKEEGFLCPQAECQKLKVQGTYSAPVYTPDDDLKVSVIFHVFDTSSLHLIIKSDRRVKSWNLTILDCSEKHNCYKEKIMTDIGNQSILLLKEHFRPDVCYGFILEPNSFGACKLWTQRMVLKDPSGCYPHNTSKINKTSKLMVGRGHSWWVVPFGAVVAVALFIISLIILVAWKHQSKMAYMQVSSRGTPEKEARHRPAVLILYAQDSETHVAMVSQLILWLKKDLHQVFDIFDDSNIEKLSNPSWWLQEMISRSSLKIVLVVSPHILDCFRALITTPVSTDVSGGWLNVDNNKLLLLAGIKHLLDKDLVKNYNRVFVISFSKTEVRGDFGLLVESRRYILPQHQDILSADIMENKLREFVVEEHTTLCSVLGDDGHPHHPTTAAIPR